MNFDNLDNIIVPAWFIIATMAMTGMSLMLTIAILNIYHHDASKPVPAWLDKLVLRLLARVLCMHKSNKRMRHVDDVDEASENEIIPQDQKHPLFPADVLKYIHLLMHKEKTKDVNGDNKNQWVQVGKVIDRFFLVSSFIAMFLTAVCMFPVIRFEGQ